MPLIATNPNVASDTASAINSPYDAASNAARAIISSLRTFSPAEAFYREYHEASKEPHTLRQFLRKYDEAYLLSHEYMIRENENTIKSHYSEQKLFGDDLHHAVVTRKHERYLPAVLHNHDFWEMFYVLEGYGCKQDISNMQYNMVPGDICIIPAGIRHALHVFDETVVINILIRRSTFEDLFFNFLRSSNILSLFFLSNMYSVQSSDYLIFHTAPRAPATTAPGSSVSAPFPAAQAPATPDPAIRNTILGMCDDYSHPDEFTQQQLQASVQTLFISILRNYGDNYELPPKVNRDNLLRFDIVQFIQDSYKDVSLEMVARKFNFTSEYTSRLIKQITGYNFTQIVQNIRMQHARSLLEDTAIPVGDISFEVGYLNPEHFVRTFKKVHHKTPSEYRNEYRRAHGE